MNEGLNVSTKRCPECGKKFDIVWCDIWAYKNQKSGISGYRYFCSWKCLRADEMKHAKPPKQLVYEEEPTRKTLKQHRQPMNSEDVIEKVLQAIEEGDSPIEVLQSMGYEHWKKWYNLKKWAEKNKPELRKRMPESLSEKKMAAG